MARFGKILILLVAISPAVLPLWIIVTKGVDYPLSDQWDDFGQLLLKSALHDARFSDFIAQSNEHRVLMSRLLYFVVNWRHWHPVREITVDLLLVFGTSACILRLLWRTFDAPGTLGIKTICVWLVCNFAIFSPQQYEVWLSALSCVIFPMLFILLGILTAGANRPIWIRTSIAIVCGAAANYSYGNGVLGWPIIGLALAYSIGKSSRNLSRAAIVWIGASAIFIMAYFIGYSRPTNASSSPYTHSLQRSGLYSLYFLGNLARNAVPFYWPDVNARAAGIVFLSLFLIYTGYTIWIWRMKSDTSLAGKMLPWLLIGSYSIGSAAMAGLTRVGFAIDHAAYTSRYVTISLWLPVSLIVCAHLCASRPVAWLFSAILTAAIIAGFPVSIDNAQAYSSMNSEGAAALLLREALPNNPMLKLIYYHDAGHLFGLVDGLLSHGKFQWPAIPSTRPTDLLSDDPSAMTGVMDNGAAFGNDAVSFGGWAMNLRRNRPADAVFICYDDPTNEPILVAQAKMDSWHDPADPYKSVTGGASGWHVIIPSELFPADLKTATITAWAMDIETGKLTKLKGAEVIELLKPPH